MASLTIAGAPSAGKSATVRLASPPPIFDPSRIMQAAHDLARAMPPRIPYAARLALALQRAWSAARAAAHAVEMRLLRRSIAERVDRLIAMMDEIDGDADFENAGDFESQLAGFSGDGDDREGDGDCDAEPSLGSLGGTAAGCDRRRVSAWAGGNRSDLEGPGNEDDEDGGDDELTGDEAEPSLASLDRAVDQRRWSDGQTCSIDRELDVLDPAPLPDHIVSRAPGYLEVRQWRSDARRMVDRLRYGVPSPNSNLRLVVDGASVNDAFPFVPVTF